MTGAVVDTGTIVDPIITTGTVIDTGAQTHTLQLGDTILQWLHHHTSTADPIVTGDVDVPDGTVTGDIELPSIETEKVGF